MTLVPDSESFPPPARQPWAERLMFASLPAWLVMMLMVLGLVVMIAFGGLLLRPPPDGMLRRATYALANTPFTLGRLLDQAQGPDRPYSGDDYARLPGGFWRNPNQPFVDPGYVLLTAFDEKLRRPVIRMLRLSDGALVHQYAPDVDKVNQLSRFTSPLIDLKRDRNASLNLMMHPLLMPDGGIITHDTSPLARFDACGKLEWMIDGIFHHSVERDTDGNIWAVFRSPKPLEPLVGPQFNDEAVMEVSPEGKVLRRERIADILDRNGFGPLWRHQTYTDDPFHLNDIEPVRGDGPYWRKGDLLLSLRNMSMLMLYRPSTGKVLWHQSGPWAFQHDVSVINDHQIAVFDNHWRFAYPEGAVNGRNRIAVYDFATGQVSYPMAQAMEKLKINTRAQGRALRFANGDFFIEETEGGRLFRVAPDGTVRWQYISADPERNRLQLRWSRYIDPSAEWGAIQKAKGQKCS